MLDSTYRVFTRLLHLLDPEMAHHVAVWSAQHHVAPRLPGWEDPILAVTLWGRRFENPVGLAAGFDKNAVAVDALQRQGFGFIEVGSVTPRPQPGNPRPRLFRLPRDQAVINRMGFNNDGHGAVMARMARRRHARPVGVNLGKNRDSPMNPDDYVAGVRAFAAISDYLVINVSSPNTPGLRALQGRAPLAEILEAASAARREMELEQPTPLLLKIAPDLAEGELADVAEVALRNGIDGMICTNTTAERPPRLRDPGRLEAGGLSGPPLFEVSTRVLSRMYRLVGGKIPLIGSGGIDSGAAAYAKIRAGATLVQLYTALIYQGPGLVNRVKRQLATLLRRDGFSCLAEAVGSDHR